VSSALGTLFRDLRLMGKCVVWCVGSFTRDTSKCVGMSVCEL
jgi:hypothetical protein